MDKNNFHKVIENIIRLNKIVFNTMKQHVKEIQIHDLSPVQSILLMFMANKKFGLLELANSYFLPNIPYNIKQMKKYGYIKQEKSKYDKRSYEISLSKKGLDTLDRLNEVTNNYFESYDQFMNLSFNELLLAMQQLEDLLKHVK